MTNAITTSSPTNQLADAASNADALLKKYSTPLTAATAIVVCVTGVMMFFHLYKGEVQAMHEWLGMGFVVAAVLHLLRHRRPLGLMMKQSRTHILLVLTLVISLAFLYPSSSQQPNPMRSTITAVMRAPLKDLAPVVGVTTAELTARFAEAGVARVDATDTIETLAKAHETDPMKLLSAAMTPRSGDETD
jgi:trans-aconitate methyltransferase